MRIRSAKTSASRFGTLGGRREGGRKRLRCERPGKTSEGVVKKAWKPRVK
jgi:hypothetical protein